MNMGSAGPVSAQVPFVESKVKAGVVLSDKELDYVKKHEPELYERAIRVDTETKVNTYNEKGTVNAEPESSKVLIDV